MTCFITWPIGWLLDRMLGEESALFRRNELKALVGMHGESWERKHGGGGSKHEVPLTADEVQARWQSTLGVGTAPAQPRGMHAPPS